MSTDTTLRVSFRIQGRVQGVSFRYYARQQAERLQLVGWVRNAPDGTVEGMVEGTEDAVERFIAWTRSGPSGADVDEVEVERMDPERREREFRIVH